MYYILNSCTYVFTIHVVDSRSMLPLKDLVKTSVLSKRWSHGQGLRMDLNFDLHNMFDTNTLKCQKTLSAFDGSKINLPQD